MEEKNPAQITRNQFLKMLVAGGGASAVAAFLPGKWLKPIVKVGVLPVHAQSTFTLTVSGLEITGSSLGSNIGKGRGLAKLVHPGPAPKNYLFSGTFHYEDEGGEVTEDSEVTLTMTSAGDPSDTTIEWYTISSFGSSSVDGYSGDVDFHSYCPISYWVTNGTILNPSVFVTLTVGTRSDDSNSVEIPHPSMP